MSLSHIGRLKLAPGMVDSINVVGRNFWVIYSPVDVEVMLPGGEWGLHTQGSGIDNLEDGKTFNRLTVRNPSLGEITVVIYVGGPLYRDSRLAIIEPKTEAEGWEGEELPATTGEYFGPIPTGDRIRRKCIQVTNLDQNLDLQLRDEDEDVILTVFPRTSITLPISEYVEVYNPNGSPVACNISEIWWTLKP